MNGERMILRARRMLRCVGYCQDLPAISKMQHLAHRLQIGQQISKFLIGLMAVFAAGFATETLPTKLCASAILVLIAAMHLVVQHGPDGILRSLLSYEGPLSVSTEIFAARFLCRNLLTGPNQFSDLFTGPGYPIPQTEMRSISLHQLNLVMKHVTRRLTGGQVWQVSRFENGEMMQRILTDPAAAQLYDVCTHTIVPATAALQLSLVEAMATSLQKPSYFVSHWCLQPRQALLQPTVLRVLRWGEEVELMIRCLRQHSKDKHLLQEKLSPGNWDEEPNPDYIGEKRCMYWICGEKQPVCPCYVS